MKRIVPFLLLFLILSGCADNVASTPFPPPSHSASANEGTSPSTQNLSSNWIYEIKEDGLYRTDRNSGKATKICIQDYASETIITENWVYFKDEKSLYRINNENKRELLLNEECWYPSLKKDWLYYMRTNGIFRIKPDGSQKKQILQYKCNGIALSDNYIFYALDAPVNNDDYSDDGPPLPLGELHRIDLNGSNDVNLGVMVTDLNVYKNIVYFSDSADHCLYAMNPDTLEKTPIYKGIWIDDLYFAGSYVFFETDHKLYRMSLADGAKTMLKEAFGIWFIGAFDDYLYLSIFGQGTDGLYRIAINGDKLEKID
jgi:hypothetical protein